MNEQNFKLGVAVDYTPLGALSDRNIITGAMIAPKFIVTSFSAHILSKLSTLALVTSPATSKRMKLVGHPGNYAALMAPGFELARATRRTPDNASAGG